MKFDKHGNGNGYDDLYILPETEEEANKIVEFLEANNLNFYWTRADVKGNDWYGNTFIEVPFCESWKENIEKL